MPNQEINDPYSRDAQMEEDMRRMKDAQMEEDIRQRAILAQKEKERRDRLDARIKKIRRDADANIEKIREREKEAERKHQARMNEIRQQQIPRQVQPQAPPQPPQVPQAPQAQPPPQSPQALPQALPPQAQDIYLDNIHKNNNNIHKNNYKINKITNMINEITNEIPRLEPRIEQEPQLRRGAELERRPRQAQAPQAPQTPQGLPPPLPPPQAPPPLPPRQEPRQEPRQVQLPPLPPRQEPIPRQAQPPQGLPPQLPPPQAPPPQAPPPQPPRQEPRQELRQEPRQELSQEPRQEPRQVQLPPLPPLPPRQEPIPRQEPQLRRGTELELRQNPIPRQAQPQAQAQAQAQAQPPAPQAQAQQPAPLPPAPLPPAPLPPQPQNIYLDVYEEIARMKRDKLKEKVEELRKEIEELKSNESAYKNTHDLRAIEILYYERYFDKKRQDLYRELDQANKENQEIDKELNERIRKELRRQRLEHIEIRQPVQPFGLPRQPVRPFGLPRQPTQPFGLPRQPVQPFGLAEQRREAVLAPIRVREEPLEQLIFFTRQDFDNLKINTSLAQTVPVPLLDNKYIPFKQYIKMTIRSPPHSSLYEQSYFSTKTKIIDINSKFRYFIISDHTYDTRVRFYSIYNLPACNVILGYLDRILSQRYHSINDIIKLSSIPRENYNRILNYSVIGEGSFGKIYQYGFNKVIKITLIQEDDYQKLFYLIILMNLESLDKLIPKIYHLNYYIDRYNQRFLLITMDKYDKDLFKYFYSNYNPYHLNKIKQQLIILLFKLYKNNLICADIKLSNMVINFISSDIDVKFIDIELDFCFCLEDEILTNEHALLFVQYNLYYLNLGTNNKLLDLRFEDLFFYELLYNFLITFDKYFFEVEFVNNFFVDLQRFKTLNIGEIDYSQFKQKNLDVKKVILHYYEYSRYFNVIEISRYIPERIRSEVETYILDCLYFLNKFKFSAPLRCYILDYRLILEKKYRIPALSNILNFG